MKRIATALLITASLAALMFGWSRNSRSGQLPALHSKNLDVTGINPNKVSYTSDGDFVVYGAPILHAVMPLKKMTLDGGTLTGKLDSSGNLSHAILTGGVHGALDSESKNGVDKITFAGSSVTYNDTGKSNVSSSVIDSTGGVVFGSSNATTGSKFELHGSHGLFHLRQFPPGGLGLLSADLDGPVTYSFSGVRVGTDKKEEPSNGHGTAGHMLVSRTGADGTDYELRLTGGVSIKGTGSGFEGDFPKMTAVTIIMDQAGNFKSLSTGEESVSGTLTPIKKS